VCEVVSARVKDQSWEPSSIYAAEFTRTPRKHQGAVISALVLSTKYDEILVSGRIMYQNSGTLFGHLFHPRRARSCTTPRIHDGVRKIPAEFYNLLIQHFEHRSRARFAKGWITWQKLGRTGRRLDIPMRKSLLR